MTSQEQAKSTYLPAGQWYDIFTDERLEGGRAISAEYAGHRIPIFAKASAIIPMQGKVQSTRDDPGPVLYVHVFNGAERSEFVYYDDDGETLNYRKGQFRKRTLVFDPAAKQLTFSRPDGNFSSPFRKIKLILHGFAAVSGVTVNGTAAAVQSQVVRMLDPLEALSDVYYDKQIARATAGSGSDEAANDTGIRRRIAGRGALALKGVLMSTRIFLAGAAVGAVVGALAVVAFRSEPTANPVTVNAIPATESADSTSAAGVSRSRAATDAVQPTSTSNVQTMTGPLVGTEAIAPSPADPGSTPEAISSSSSDPGDELLQAYAQIKDQSRGETAEQLSDRMRAEARDEAWASYMENALRDYLARQPYPNALGSPSVECRMTLCRILTAVDDVILVAMPNTDLQAAMYALQQESLGGEVVIGSVEMMVDLKHSGRTIEAAFVRRSKQSSSAKP